MTRKDLSQATFIIPIRIESSDRLRNVITIATFLMEQFETNIIIKEVDKESRFKKEALPIIEEIAEVDIWQNFNFIFEYSEDPLFHRQKVLNEMISITETPIVVNYDCDAILPVESYVKAYEFLINGDYDVVYPYGQGMYQKQVHAIDSTVSKFLETGNYEHLNLVSKDHTSDFGWVQFFKTDVYKEGGMENENFKAYAPEDKERHYRFTTMGYKVGRINDFVYHLEHERGENSWFSNPYMEDNMMEWTRLGDMNKDQLIEYYSKQKYLEKYK